MGGKGKELEGQGRAGQAKKIHRVKPGKKMEPPALRSGMQDPPPLMSGQGGMRKGAGREVGFADLNWISWSTRFTDRKGRTLLLV